MSCQMHVVQTPHVVDTQYDLNSVHMFSGSSQFDMHGHATFDAIPAVSVIRNTAHDVLANLHS